MRTCLSGLVVLCTLASATPREVVAQGAPRLEAGVGLATPIGGGAFAGAGPAVRLTALGEERSGGPSQSWALRADLSYGAPGLADGLAASSGGDLTVFTLGAEWRVAPSRHTTRPYLSAGLGVASGFYGDAARDENGRASGGAAMLAMGARGALRQLTLGVELGLVYGPLRRSALIPLTLVVGF